MVEIYLNCQSDNGALTESTEISSRLTVKYDLIALDRSRSSAVELEIF